MYPAIGHGSGDDESIDRSTTKDDDRKSVKTMMNKVTNAASFD